VFTDLGLGEAFGLNLNGVTIGRNGVGDGGLFTDVKGVPLVSQGRQPVDLGFPGTMLRINDYDLAVGHDDSQGGPKPVALYPFRLSTLSFLPLPSGEQFGSAMRVTDGDRIGGDVFTTAVGSDPRPQLWVGKFSEPGFSSDSAEYAALKAGSSIDVGYISGINDTCGAAGSLTTKAGTEVAFVVVKKNVTDEIKCVIAHPPAARLGHYLRDVLNSLPSQRCKDLDKHSRLWKLRTLNTETGNAIFVRVGSDLHCR
jgi:hypothetical protein